MKLTTLMKIYLAVGIAVSGWFLIAALSGWKAPNLGLLDGSSSGRSGGRAYGGYWGGGK